MIENEDIVKELSHICNQLTSCIEQLVRVQHRLLNNVVCGVCQKQLAVSECTTCGMNMCTTCELTHTHTKPSQT
jgi:hypothetical protein